MNLNFSITELSNLTKKSRPSLYKYIDAYEAGTFDEIPYSFIQLFSLMKEPNTRKKDIIKFCNETFLKVQNDEDINQIIELLNKYKEKINFERLKAFIEQEAKQ